jgi:GrpB-like predicted nucleotidyltransferase (UPF0157 family)
MSVPIRLVEYDPQWPDLFRREAARIRPALGDRALRIEHIGSTSVPGLAAKPVIDIVVTVADSSQEAEYVHLLDRAGYRLRLREPGWHEHRMFSGPDTRVNLHVYSQSCPEVDRILVFRDWLRNNPDDRELYARTKRELAQRTWRDVQDYADAKTAVIGMIMARALSSVTRSGDPKLSHG